MMIEAYTAARDLKESAAPTRLLTKSCVVICPGRKDAVEGTMASMEAVCNRNLTAQLVH